ncbi:hypothetical protein D3C71_1769790 [compost metagenome]
MKFPPPRLPQLDFDTEQNGRVPVADAAAGNLCHLAAVQAVQHIALHRRRMGVDNADEPDSFPL